jgi:hypothetical protein
MATENDRFGFGGKQPTPARPESLKLADAIYDMLQVRKALAKAKKAVPDYTGQWSDEDYYAEEQEAYNRAADRLAEVIGV